MRENLVKIATNGKRTIKRNPGRKGTGHKAEPVGRRAGGGWDQQGQGGCLNHTHRKEDQGCPPKGGDQILSGSTKHQLRINYSPRDVGETGRTSRPAG